MIISLFKMFTISVDSVSQKYQKPFSLKLHLHYLKLCHIIKNNIIYNLMVKQITYSKFCKANLHVLVKLWGYPKKKNWLRSQILS